MMMMRHICGSGLLVLLIVGVIDKSVAYTHQGENESEDSMDEFDAMPSSDVSQYSQVTYADIFDHLAVQKEDNVVCRVACGIFGNKNGVCNPGNYIFCIGAVSSCVSCPVGYFRSPIPTATSTVCPCTACPNQYTSGVGATECLEVASQSASATASESTSETASESLSRSLSGSISPSVTASESATASESRSTSDSVTQSISDTASVSHTPSLSISPEILRGSGNRVGFISSLLCLAVLCVAFHNI